MKTSQQIEINQHSKRRGCRFWIVLFALLLGFSPLLFYYGYCWGLWGRSSLLLQYLFQCNCPPASEEARHSKQVDVIISACQKAFVDLSPSGRYLDVYEEKSGLASTYLLDLQTMERIDMVDQPSSSFLTDDMGFIESGLEDDIIDRKTGIQYPIKTFRYWQENAYVNGELNVNMLVSALRQAEHVFFTQRNNDTVVVLMPSFPTNPDQSFTFNRSNISSGNFNDRVEQFLQENNIPYQTIPEDFRDEAVSPDGKFVARIDGIYEIETGQKIVDGYSFGGFFQPSSGRYLQVRGWTNDSSGVIYSRFLNPCVIRMGMMDTIACFGEVPQPVIKLRVPEEYLLPTETP